MRSQNSEVNCMRGNRALMLFLAASICCTLACGAEKTPQISKESDPEWKQKHTSFVARAKQGDIPLIFLGDSITEYWSTAGKDVWERNFAPLHAANFGIAADKVEN